MKAHHALRSSLLAMVVVPLTVVATGAVFGPEETDGRVVDSHGRPVSGATAEMVAGGTVRAATRSDAAGTFRLSGPRIFGDFRVRLTADGYLPALLKPAGGAAVLHRSPRFVGRVLDETGAGVGAASVVLTDARGWQTEIGSDDEGFFWVERDLRPGRTSVTASAPRHDPGSEVVLLESDHTVQVSLLAPRQMATVTLDSSPSGQAVKVDGRALGGCATTPCRLDLEVGTHTVDIDAELYVPWHQEVTLGKGDAVAFNPVLERKRGTLAVSAPDSGDADLQIDGQKVAGPTWTGLVPTGDHTISFRSSAYWPFQAPVHIDWDKRTDLELKPVSVQGDDAAFLAGLQAYLGSLGPGRFGVDLIDLRKGAEVGVGQNTVMEAASVIKLPVALYYYRQVEAGKIKPEDQVTLQDSDFMGGTGILWGSAKSGDTYSYRDLNALLIQHSDNTAWMALKRSFGSDAVDGYSASIGAPDCHQASDGCTARQAAVMLAGLAGGKLLNSQDSAGLILLLENTDFNDRINYYLAGIQIAHKVGMDGGVINDAGIVFLSGRPFVISVFTDTSDPSVGVQAIREVARAAAYHYSH